MCIECLRIWITSVFRYYDDGDHHVYFRAPVQQVGQESNQLTKFIISVDSDAHDEGLMLLNKQGFQSLAR